MEEDGVKTFNSKFWRCFPPSRTSLLCVLRRNKGCCCLHCCLPPSCAKRTAFCFVSSLKLTQGSVYDETCLGNHLPWEGWGHPAQAAPQLCMELSGAAPALAIPSRPPLNQPQALDEQEHHFPPLPKGSGGSVSCCTTPYPTCPGHTIFHLAPYQRPALL